MVEVHKCGVMRSSYHMTKECLHNPRGRAVDLRLQSIWLDPTLSLRAHHASAECLLFGRRSD